MRILSLLSILMCTSFAYGNQNAAYYISGGYLITSHEALSSEEQGFSVGFGNYVPLTYDFSVYSEIQYSYLGDFQTDFYESYGWNIAPTYESMLGFDLSLIAGLAYLYRERNEDIGEGDFSWVWGASVGYRILPALHLEMGYKSTNSSMSDFSTLYTELKLGF